MAKLPDEIIEGVAIGNLKSISEQPAMLSNLAYSNTVNNTNLSQQNSVSNQQSMNELVISTTAKGSNTISNLTPMEARSAVDVLTNNELAQTIADLKSTLQAFQGSSSNNGGKTPDNVPGAPVMVEFSPSIDADTVSVVEDAGYSVTNIPSPEDQTKLIGILIVPNNLLKK